MSSNEKTKAEKTNSLFTTKKLALIAVMTAVICIVAPFSIPLPISPVPISFTNLAIYLALYVLGMKAGTISYLIYLLIGLVGLPVFSGFTGGASKLAGPTGGYLVGFIFLALIAGFLMDRFAGNLVIEILGMVLGLAVCYIFGTIWLAKQMEIDFWAGLGFGVIPYLPGDAVKIIIAAILGPRLRREVKRQAR